MSHRRFTLVWTTIALSLAHTSSVFAHPGHLGDFQAGWQHPLLGLDHLLAMIAVGLLAVRSGGRSLWLMPAAFLGSMLLGGMAAAAGLPLPGVEVGVIASVLVLGWLIATTRVAPRQVAVALVMLFAFFHGHAHASEMLANGSLAPFAAGFLLSTALLHTAGIAVGMIIQKLHRPEAFRLAGGAIVAAGLLLVAGLI
jgi:urease accessory protein